MDVYDEKCETQYPAKCTEDQSCTMVYQTKCDTMGYTQKCTQIPVRKCQPITKCHRIPKTTCKPFKKEKCGNRPTQVPVRKMKHRCMPYESKEPEDNLAASCGQNNQPSSDYGAPNSNINQNPSIQIAPTLADMIPPRGPINQDSYGSPVGNLNEDSYGTPQGNPLGNSNNLNEDTYGSPQGQVIIQNQLQDTFISADDAYGSPGGAAQQIPNKYISPGSNPFVEQISNNAIPNVVSAPQNYAGPNQEPDGSGLLTPRQKIQPYQQKDTTLATIRVVS